MDNNQNPVRVQLADDAFLIPSEFVGERYSNGIAQHGINITLLLPEYTGIFAGGNNYELVPEKIDVMWNERGQRLGSDANVRLVNAIKYKELELVDEYSNVKVYKDGLFDSAYYYFTLPQENRMIIDCSRDTPIKMCRAFYYQEQLETGVFFSFRAIHLDKAEKIYENINRLICEWRQ